MYFLENNQIQFLKNSFQEGWKKCSSFENLMKKLLQMKFFHPNGCKSSLFGPVIMKYWEVNTEQIFYIIWLLLDILIKPMFIFVGYPNGYSLSSTLNLEKTSSCHKCWKNGFSSDPNTLDSYFSPNYRSPRSNSIT